jgi:two-component system, chemotaxis family, sensor kinase CheA
VTLSDAAAVKPIEEGQELVVIVFNARGREVGLLGAMPVDVIETRATVDSSTLRQTGIVGSTILRDRTVLLVELQEVVQMVYPEWGMATTGITSENGKAHTVLLAEDSDFFRAQIKRFLSEDGYDVLEAPDGEAAWEVLLGNIEKIEVLVTDIEMPRLTGLELTQRIRADQRFTKLPIIGLTSLAGEEDIERGKAAGIDDYQVKLDRDKLVASLRDFMAVEHAAYN